MKLAALDRGSGPVALLLHGQPGRATHWLRVIEALEGEMRVIAPDRPGYGDSEEAAAGFFANAESAVDLLDRLGIESAVLAGHSWGCGAAMAMACRFPERVAALVLVGTIVPRPRPERVDRALATRLFGRPATRLGFLAGGIALSIPSVRRLAHSAAPGFGTDELRRAAAEWRGDRVWRSFFAEQRALVDEFPALASEIASIPAPVTILSGRHDPIATPARVRTLARALPNARAVKLDVGGHLLPQQRPDLVAEAILAAARSTR